jgi:hypothetical protein
MLVAFLSLLNGTPAGTCMLKAAAAFVVFAGFGLIVRYAVADSLEQAEEKAKTNAGGTGFGQGANLDMIVPGTSVADLLGSHAEPTMTGDAEDDTDEEQAAA